MFCALPKPYIYIYNEKTIIHVCFQRKRFSENESLCFFSVIKYELSNISITKSDCAVMFYLTQTCCQVYITDVLTEMCVLWKLVCLDAIC